MDKLISWVKKNKIEVTILVLILVLAVFFRFYRIDEYMTFLGDEGRDALVVKKILTQLDFPLLGAPTSVSTPLGNMYNGPLYYYMMAFSMLPFWLNPVAAAGMVALIGVLTVGLVYYLTREWFGKQAAIASALLYAVSPINIIYSRSSWNPNPAPFFALLTILGLYLSHKTKNYYWLILTGASIAFAIQMHFLALILLPIAGVIWVYELRNKIKLKSETKNFWKGLILAFVAFLFLMSPLAIYDFKYNFQNYRTFEAFFLGDRATTINLNPLNSLGRTVPVYSHNLVNRYITGEQSWLMIIVSLLILIPVISLFYKLSLSAYAVKLLKREKISWPIFALSVWLIIGVVGLALYKGNIYDHYLTFLNPVIFILFGANIHLINSIDSKKVNQILRGVFFLLVLILVIVNLQKNPLQVPPNNQLYRTQEVAKFVINESRGSPFNFALIAKSNYDAAYQFYLDMYNHKPLTIYEKNTDQLLVVCEDKECNPINNPKDEIARFGWAKVEWEKEFQGVKVYKLIHNVDEKQP